MVNLSLKLLFFRSEQKFTSQNLTLQERLRIYKFNMSFSRYKYIPTYCDKKLVLYERNFDRLDLSKWEDFEKDRDSYINNAKIVSFDEIYNSVGIKPVGSNLKHFRKTSPEELNSFKPLEHFETVDEKDLKMPQDEKSKAVSACRRSCRKNIFVSRSVVNSQFKNISKNNG